MTVPRHLRVFLSSPGDVGDERAIAMKVIDDLQYDPLLRDKITFETIAWDKPGSDVPLLATLPPQEAVNRGLLCPAECHIVIVIFWSRMGTPLPRTQFTKPNGEQYLSGTEWEYLNALQGATERDGLPLVVVYRRTEKPPFDATDPNYDQKKLQYDRVQDFFKEFKNPDGSAERGYNPYNTPDTFRSKLENHLKVLVKQLLEEYPPDSFERSETTLKTWQGSPFPGLRAFTPADAPIFFGRGSAVDALIHKLKQHNLVAVFGASGSGKSSLVAAGLIPRLRQNAIEGSKDWLLPDVIKEEDQLRWTGMRLKPTDGESPFHALARQLQTMIPDDVRSVDDLVAALCADEELLGTLLLEQLADQPDWAAVLIVVDQFEELFTLIAPAQRAPFVIALIRAAQTNRVRVVFTLRADFLDQMMQLPELVDHLQDSTYPLATPGTVAYYDMIRKPAERAGLTFEEGLIERILTDAGQQEGSLPLLAYTLDELYEARDADGTISAASYERLGGIEGAIAHRAEMVYRALSNQARAALRPLFRKLAEVSADGIITRRTATVDDLTHEQQVQLAQALADARLLVVNRDEKKRKVYQVAHEAVFTSWKRLASLLQEEIDFFRWRHRIELDSDLWHQDHDNSLLYLGNKLDEANGFVRAYPDDLTGEQREFIQASRNLAWRNRVVRGAILAVPIMISVITIGGVLNNWRLQQQALSYSAMTTFPAATVPLGADDEPTFVDAFRIGQHEVSYEQYRLCIRAGACDPPQEPPQTVTRDEDGNVIANYQIAEDTHPIVYMTANNAADYCAWVGQRLPTMQEWERAVRGFESITIDAWVTEVVGDASQFNLATYSDIEPVGYEDTPLFYEAQTPGGLQHMIGNVAEWTSTLCYGEEYSTCTVTWDGKSIPDGDLRVMGYSRNDASILISEPATILTEIYTANAVPSTTVTDDFGFRCAADA